jgi:hypothetical protein
MNTTAASLLPSPPGSRHRRPFPHSSDELELCSGLAAETIDGHLLRATRGRDISNRILAFYLDEFQESGKYRDLGYSCLAQYASQRLEIEPRRARELCQAGRALLTLSRIDAACRAGDLSWTKAELLTHAVQECEQDEWLARAQGVSCSELKQMLRRHRQGLCIEKGRDGGLPRSEFDVHATLPAAAHDKLEQIRQMLMQQRGEFVDDSDALAYVLAKHELPVVDVSAEAERMARAESEETPDWLRRRVLGRDDHRCQACGASHHLHVHHIVFRSRGGLTREENLAAACKSCHGLIHEGRLFAEGRAPEVVFRNRAGERLVSRGAAGSAVPRTVLRLLRGEGESGGQPPRSVPGGDGGHPPRSIPGGAGGRAPCPVTAGERRSRYLNEDEIPEDITPEWFRQHMHLFDVGRDGVWRPKRSKRRQRR